MSKPVTLRAVPLGGLGHVGGNSMAYETEDDLLIVDCGVLFPSVEQPGVDYIIPDVAYILERRHKLRGFVLTHGHEDHIGALPYVLAELDAPVYGTRLTLDLLRNRLREHPDTDPELVEMHDGQPVQLGSFAVQPIPVTHSIPGAVMLAIRTPVGVVVHTGDFKLDPEPLDGRMTDLDALRRLGDEGVTALFSDSTNAERSGHTWSEREVGCTLRELIGSAPGRVLVTGFASNLHRLQMIIDASDQAGRRVLPAGRSMQQNIQLGLEHGYIRARFGAVGELSEIGRLPPSRVTVIASGSQGEPGSAMTRIAAGQHGQVRLQPGDRVILSSRRIPGNERPVNTMVNNLFRLGVEVIDDRTARVHASGHAFNDEQQQVIELLRPHFFVPIHGEYRHLVRHAMIAEKAGLSRQAILVVEDGHPVELTAEDGAVRIAHGEPVQAGHVFVDGKSIGDVGPVVLRDRRALSQTGMVTCVVILDEEGRVQAGPDLTTRGVLYPDAQLIEEMTDEVRRVLGQRTRWVDPNDCGEEMRVALRRFLRRRLDRRPLVIPVVMSL